MTSKEKIIGQWEGRIESVNSIVRGHELTINDVSLEQLIYSIIRNKDTFDEEVDENCNVIEKYSRKYKLTLSIIEDDVK